MGIVRFVRPILIILASGLWVGCGYITGGVQSSLPIQNTANTSGPAPLSLLKQINATANTVSEITIGTLTYYVGYDSSHGNELWKSDGTAAGTVLVKDINPGASDSSPANFYNLNGVLYFTANDGTHGTELWKSDGTEAGTALVKDIYPGSTSSEIWGYGNANGILIFSADDGTNGVQVWRSDGTSAGTYMLQKLDSGSSDTVIADFTNLNSKVFFIYDSGVDGKYQLGVTDGTAAGTSLVNTSAGGYFYAPVNLFAYNNEIYFVPMLYLGPTCLWKSDGTAAGTVGVASLPTSSSGWCEEDSFYLINGKMLINAPTTGNTYVLYASDGTSAGTVQINSNGLEDGPFDVGGTWLFFLDTSSGIELWQSDGTSAGTTLVLDFNTSATTETDRDQSDKSHILVVGNTLYFGYNDQINGYQLWKSDGTTAGTVMVKNISGSTASSDLTNLTSFNGLLYFTAQDSNGVELWSSDGTSSGTSMVKDIWSGSGSSGPNNLSVVNNTLFFTAANSSLNLPSVYLSDGTASGTVADNSALVQAANANTNGGSQFVTLGTEAYFGANDRAYGEELWQTDGTPSGTTLVTDIFPSGSCAALWDFGVYNNSLFFEASDATHTYGVPYISSGTAAGTSRLSSTAEELVSSAVQTSANEYLYITENTSNYYHHLWKTNMTTAGTSEIYSSNALTDLSLGSYDPVAGLLYLMGTTASAGEEPWVTNGTSAGTFMLKDIYSGSYNGFGGWLGNLNGKELFAANDGTHGSELWVTNGTSAGTSLVDDIYSGSTGSNPEYGTVLGSQVIFWAQDATHGIEPWVTDGTLAGTKLLLDINSGSGSSIYTTSSGTVSTVFNGEMYFVANDGVHGNELWKTDGTATGTTLVKDINPTGDSDPSSFFVFNNQLYFKATDGAHGYQIWVTDGTEVGTVMESDINDTAGGIQKFGTPFVFNGKFYVSLDDGTHGAELWVSDGTTAGTSMLEDLNPGTSASSPENFAIINGHLIFFATTNGGGTQPYVLN